MEKQVPKAVEFNNLGSAIDFVDSKMEALENAGKGYAVSFQELTGYMPQHAVTALDVVKIFNNMTKPKVIV